MDVRLPDGTVIQNVPDGTTKDQLRAKLSAAGHDIHKMGLGPTADDIPLAPGAKERMAAQAALPKVPEDNLLGKVVGGVIETPLAIGTGMIGGAAGAIAGVGKAALKKLTTGQGSSDKEVNDTTAAVSNALTYQPRTQTGNALVRGAGEALESSGVAGIPIPELNALGRGMASSSQALRGLAAPSAAAMAAQDAAQAAGGGSLRNLLAKPQPTMAGVGAADTEAAALRAQRFADFGVKPTQGQLTRTFEQTQFEREAAKKPEGKRINDRFAEQNAQVAGKLEEFSDQTGMQGASLRASGRAVVDALERKKAAKKAEINAAYTKAREAGDMAELVDVQPLLDYVGKNRSALRNAPILGSIEDEVNRLSGGTGKISLNDMEALRQMTGNLAQPGTPNAVYGKNAIGLIDQVTEGKGGPQYQQARRLYENYSNEFTNRDVIDKLLRNKPGSKDRAVAYEDVFKHSVLNGSLDDVRHVRRVLQTAGPEGEQAWKELQGQTMQHIKEQMFSNSGADTMGNTVGSAAKIERLVRELDKDGKLDFVFGKQGAQQVRDAKDLAIDMYTSPPGTVNSSNTASAMERILDKAAGIGGNVPVVGGALKYVAKRAESNALSKKVDAALNPPQNALARRPTQP